MGEGRWFALLFIYADAAFVFVVYDMLIYTYLANKILQKDPNAGIGCMVGVIGMNEVC